jgi:UrcA family protein
MTPRIAHWALASLAAAAFWPAAPPVMAQSNDLKEVVVNGERTDGEAIRHQTVYYADLDLRRDAGARTLLARIRGAATNVCEPDPSIHDLKDQWNHRICLYDAVSGALHVVDNPRVADLYDGEG